MFRHSRVLVTSLVLMVVALVSFFGSQLFAGNHTALAAQPSGSGTPSTGVALPSCLSSATPPRCYSPQQIRAAYGIQPLLDAGITGKGHTIVIIGNNPYPNMKDDLHLYDQMFGLSDPAFNIIEPFGPVSSTPGAPQLVQDVEVAHAIAPGATIDLVAVDASKAAGPPARITALLRGTEYAIGHNLGDIISQSFAAGESCLDPTTITTTHQAFQEATAEWAGLMALADQLAGHSLGFVNAALYRIGQSSLAVSAFHDITIGNNTFSYPLSAGSPPITVQGYSAGPGWDAMTGLGSPRASVLVPLLAHSVRPGDGNGL